MSKFGKFISLIVCVLLVQGFVSHINVGGAYAWTNSRLMDDAIFDNAGSMTEQDIRNFIHSRPSSCLATSGAIFPEPKSYSDYGPNNVDAARVIYLASQYWGINPQVILATLQKEQTLITTTNCFESSGKDKRVKAMGMGCFEGPNQPCPQAAYYGFEKQVTKAAWQLKYNKERANGNVDWRGNSGYTYPGPWTEGYRKACGSCSSIYRDGYWTIDGQSVYIETGATASLYRYTPHLNQSFPRIFEGWFGPTTGSLTNAITMTTIAQPDSSPARGQSVTYTFALTNTLGTDLTLAAVGVVGRAGDVNNGSNRDFGWVGPVSLAANETKQFTFTTIIKDVGRTYAWPALRVGNTYGHYNNWGVAMDSHLPNLSLVSNLSSSVSTPVVGQTATLVATIRNDEDQPLTINAIGIPVRFYGSYSYDTGWTSPPSPLSPGATLTVSGPITFDKTGSYNAWLSALIDGQYTTLSPSLKFDVKQPTPNFQLSYLETPNPSPAIGEDVNVKFKLKNNTGVPLTLDAIGVVGRYGSPYNGKNNDFGWDGPVTFAAGEEKAFTTFIHNISDLQNYFAWVAINYKGSYTHYNNWGLMMSPRNPNLSLAIPLTINSGTPPVRGQPTPVTVTIKNNEARPIKFSALGIPARFYNYYNYDATWQGPGILAPSGQEGDSISLSGNVVFDKPGPYSLWTSIYIHGRYIVIGDIVTVNVD